ncbi:hypothetical protein D3C73_1480490 [compost metagenome]
MNGLIAVHSVIDTVLHQRLQSKAGNMLPEERIRHINQDMNPVRIANPHNGQVMLQRIQIFFNGHKRVLRVNL